MTRRAPSSGAVSLAGMIRAHAADRAAAPAVTCGSRSLTFGDLDERASKVAAALTAQGVAPGDRVAYLDKNAPEFFELMFACAKLGAVLAPLNWRLAEPELMAIVADCGAEVLIVGAEFDSLAEAVAESVSRLRKVLVVGDSATFPSYEQWTGAQAPVDSGHEGKPDDVVLQLYTSGTTGEPKGVMLSEQNLMALASSGVEVLGLDQASVNLVPMPLFHIGGSGYALVGLYSGCHTILVRQTDAPKILLAISEHLVTNTFVVPAVLSMMLAIIEDEPFDLSSLRVVSYGASPISENVLTRAMEAFGCCFVQAYGLTETTGTVTLLSDEDHRRALAGEHPERLRSAGRPVPGAAVKIIDVLTRTEQASGEVGEIWIRSRQNTVGYWEKPTETAALFGTDGWLRSGDAGYVDAENYLFIHDRVKDMIISGGENVYPAEVENVLMSHPEVSDVAVIGVPSDRWGETVKAVVVKVPDTEPEAEAIMAFARERLAHYKCPKSVEFADALPRNPSGKVLKRELRAPYWEDQRRPVG